jgi:HSP20 family protein
MAAETTIANQGQAQAAPAEHTRAGLCFRPNVDILERPDELLLIADMPGVGPNDIDIHFEDRQLTISGHVKPRHDDDAQYLIREYGVGDFCRMFQISEQIDAGKISAKYSNGVLTLHLPKVEAMKPRKISVQTTSA